MICVHMRLKPVFLISSFLALGVTASTLLQESFEADNGIVIGAFGGQNGWTHAGGAAFVQTNTVQSGSQALEMTEAVIEHDISSTNDAVWIRFQARISAAPQNLPAQTSTDAGVAFYVSTNLNIVASSNAVPVDLGCVMPTNVWTRFDIYCDYDLFVWNLSMNGNTIGANLPLSSSNTALQSVQLSSTSTAPVYFDQLECVNHELASGAPDFDSDSIPDWWELKNFGGITSAPAANLSGNNGMSFLETYIAGVHPFSTDPFIVSFSPNLSWKSVPGRRYQIQWTPNLASNFMPLAAVDWPIDEFSDTTNTAETAGFYRLQVFVP